MLDHLTQLGAVELIRLSHLMGFDPVRFADNLGTFDRAVYLALAPLRIVNDLAGYILLALGIWWLYKALKRRGNGP